MCRLLNRAAAWAAALALALLVPLLAPASTAVAAPSLKPVVDLGAGTETPAVATNSRGDTAAVYRTDSALVVRTRKAGGSWSVPATLFSGSSVTSVYDVGIDGRGRATVVMLRDFGDETAVFVRSQTSAGWGGPKQVSSRSSGYPAVELDVAASGAAVIALADGGILLHAGAAAAAVPGVRAIHRAAGSRRWSVPKLLVRVDDSSAAQVTIDDRGRATVVWRRTTASSAVLESRTSNGSGAFGKKTTVAGGDGIVWSWRLAGNPAGTASVVWQWDTGAAGDEYVMTRIRKPGRSFGAPKRLASVRTDVGRFDELDTAVAANGTITTAWRRSGTPNVVEARQRGRNQVWSATRTIPAGSVTLYDLRLEPAAGNAVAVLWAHYEGEVARVSSRVLSANGSVSAARQVMTTNTTSYSSASSPAGDAVVGGLHAGRVWARTLDTAGPVARLRQPSARFTSGRKVTGAWTAADAWSAVSSYTVLRRAAKARGGFGGTSKWTTTGSRRMSFTGVPGTTYCLTVRAKDSVGNSGAPSAERCVAVPLDDRGLAASPGWATAKSKGSYLGTVRSTSANGRTLSVKVRTKRLALLVSRCPSCGVVDVFLGNTKLKRISLAGQARKRVLVPVKTFGSVRSGTVRIVVVSIGKKVVIDGLATAQR